MIKGVETSARPSSSSIPTNLEILKELCLTVSEMYRSRLKIALMAHKEIVNIGNIWEVFPRDQGLCDKFVSLSSYHAKRCKLCHENPKKHPSLVREVHGSKFFSSQRTDSDIEEFSSMVRKWMNNCLMASIN